MIVIIAGTNRKDSKTLVFSRFIYERFREMSAEPVHLIDLRELEKPLLNSNINGESDLSPILRQIQDEKIIPSDKWILISPEYNGGFPGIVKWFIDVLSVRKYTQTFAGKKVGLIGIASGRSGNLRGMEALTGIFNYLKLTVYPDKLPVSSVKQILNEADEIEKMTQDVLSNWVRDFLKWSAPN